MTLSPSRPTADSWPGLFDLPSGPRNAVASPIARRLFRAAVSRLDVTVEITLGPGRREVLGRGGPLMRIHRPEEFYARIGRDGLIGFGEAYMTGSWDADDLGGFLTVLAAEMATLVPASLQRARALVVARTPHFHKPDRDRSRDLIAHHYDLSNDLFRLFLDPTLSYSSALFESDPSGRPLLPADLETAQVRKIERLLDVTGVGEGTRVLEIGTGWGELALRAAQRGAHVHSVTLSTEQLELARERVATAGVADRVDIELCDYRAIPDQHPGRQYDAVLSVEMIEAVGAEYWPSYFSTIDTVLAPGGKVGIQAITMPHDRMLATRGQYTWINKYIFPGGFLPSVRAIEEVTRDHTTMRVADILGFGQHYAETLRQWDTRFLAARDERAELGFDEVFERMWHLYLEYSRAGFASGYLDVNQIVLERPQEKA
ncbi:class I SAM-dependent methyltransferase [Nocardioides euryhalodurans]|uniref:Methyltransferase domain-containing protein n=1 Tax=Nocardioides euryhalodurans TaxID=2518370 RepID=A0A4P7GMQ0_9ACTN|nr:class I SAM-dependent methyltransferase [Nocardioides euryhalodurans]QBR93061.1 methyltransferase domain-containing protein [Nocardioides euryhalodurans]